MRLAAGSAIFATVLALCGCTGKNCTLVGMESSVGVSLPSSSWRLVQFCVDDHCVSDASTIEVDDDPADYSYRLEAVDPAGSEIRRDGTVSTESFRVNGAGCDPRTANATVTLASDGTVTISHP